MKFKLLIESKEQNQQSEVAAKPDIRVATLPYVDAPHLSVDGVCPCCPPGTQGPFTVRGDEKSKAVKDDLTFYCVAYCEVCRKAVGTLKVERQTLFGLDEDLRVLQGRCRVY